MLLHVYVSREAALDARKSRHGPLTVDVGDEWLQALGEAELDILKHCGTEKDPVGRDITRTSGSRYYHDRKIELAEPTPEAVAAWLTATAEAIEAYRAKKEQKAREMRAEHLQLWEERALSILDEGVDGVIRSVYAESYSLQDWPSVYGLDEKEVREEWSELAAKLDDLYAAAKRVAEERMREKAAEVEVAKQKKAEAKELHDRERFEWIAKHGSKHLKDLVEHGFPFAETYRTERREMELGEDWVDYKDICGSVKEIRDPSWEALKAWKEMRKFHADKGWTSFKAEDIKLQWLGDGLHGDAEDTDDYSCPLCGDEIRQRPVLTLEYMDTLYIHEIETVRRATVAAGLGV